MKERVVVKPPGSSDQQSPYIYSQSWPEHPHPLASVAGGFGRGLLSGSSVGRIGEGAESTFPTLTQGSVGFCSWPHLYPSPKPGNFGGFP